MRNKRSFGDERGFSGAELLVVLGIAGMLALLATAAGYGVNRKVVAEKRVGGMTLDEVLATPTPQPPPAPAPEVKERVITRERVVTPPQPQDPVIILTPPDPGTHVEQGEEHTTNETGSSGGGHQDSGDTDPHDD